MTTIYVPRPIRSIEDAEALPEGTPLLCLCAQTGGILDNDAVTDDLDVTSVLPVPAWQWVALVPVEATEVYDVKFSDGPFPASMTRGEAEHARVVYSNLGEGSPGLITRLVTDWDAVEGA